MDAGSRKRPAPGAEARGGAKAARLGEELIPTTYAGATLIEQDGKTAAHEVAWPEGLEGSSAPPAPRDGPAAKGYPFTLDPFQRCAINCLETGHSVLVAAHTSAGKTVIAQYCCAMGLRDKQRVIYTSPLKALSNQKYREFYEEFRDVGLLTGDVTINPNASCLVMTTEILRSMLYNGSEVVRETALIVYDEIHYLRDAERGVVWEESIVLAPRTARFAFLSATIPNAREFAAWIAHTHGSPCHVVYTDFRPTPLQHYVFPAGGDGLFMVVDERGAFRQDNFAKAVAALSDAATEAASSGAGGKRGKKGAVQEIGKKDESDISKMVRMIMARQFDPVIIFSFSKKECEALALQMQALELNNDDERALVEGVFWNAIDCLSEADRRLPQVGAILPMLKRGVGVHHSGLLPILKEVIEILFQEGLLKALFATETFSTGLNMPAKTVVFTNARKFDGGGFRWLTSGEYIQMSGRAGRRGLDDRGVVMLMLDTRMEPAVAQGMLHGAPDALSSAFHLSYTMLLNLLRGGGATPEQLLRASFRQFQTERALPALRARAAALEADRDAVEVQDEAAVTEYAALAASRAEAAAAARAVLTQPAHILPFLQPGRLAGGGGGGVNAPGGQYIVDVLVSCAPDSVPGRGPRRRAQPMGAGAEGVPLVVPAPLGEIDALSALRIHLPQDLRPPDARALALKAVGQVEKRHPRGLPLLDPEEDLHISDPAFRKAQRKLETAEGRLEKHALAGAPDLAARLAALARKQAAGAAAAVARREAKRAQGLILADELKARRRVLRRLGYVDAEGLVTVKGRVAAEVQSADELLLTELLFTGVFQELSVEAAVALVSCLVWRERGDGGGTVRAELQGPLAALREAARRIGKVAAEARMGLDVEEYVASFRPDLADALFQWCRGASFAEIAKLSHIFEGTLVRAVRRTEEVLRQAAAGAAVMGEAALMELFQQGSARIKRDVVFAASLYL
ncbi:hypothetical protein WJX81_000998 [Elliptochloris bilobata]|uniref:Antiviral helicase n=1 Tax=Elliptochloris bilobata TaxID=381761 RepID=A0AAW1S5P0_9CHLO